MLQRLVFLLLYYGVLRGLPDGYDHHAFAVCNRLRGWACRHLFRQCGHAVNIHQGARFGTGRCITMGDYANLGVNIYINGRGGVSIGAHVLMGPDIIIYTGTHTFKDPHQPIQLQPMIFKPVVIEDDVWIGARTVVLPGITLGHGSIIGANSTVTHDIPPNVVAGGSPARIIRPRFEEQVVLERAA